MPETKLCPRCGQLCELVTYEVAGAWSPGHAMSPHAGQAIDVWECPDRRGCGWEEDA